MQIKTFTVGVYTFKDTQTLRPADQQTVAIALRDGLQRIPGGDRCDARGIDPEGDYPMLSFGIFKDKKLVGAWWLGCNQKTTVSTAQNVVLDSVPLAGWTQGNEDIFRPRVLVPLGIWILNNQLERDDGGTVQVATLTITYDTANKAHGPILENVRDRAATQQGLHIATTSERGRTKVVFTSTGGI